MHALTLRVAFSLIWLFAPERSSRKRWSRAILEMLRRRLSGKFIVPRSVFFSCSLIWARRTINPTDLVPHKTHGKTLMSQIKCEVFIVHLYVEGYCCQ